MICLVTDSVILRVISKLYPISIFVSKLEASYNSAFDVIYVTLALKLKSFWSF